LRRITCDNSDSADGGHGSNKHNNGGCNKHNNSGGNKGNKTSANKRNNSSSNKGSKVSANKHSSDNRCNNGGDNKVGIELHFNVKSCGICYHKIKLKIKLDCGHYLCSDCYRLICENAYKLAVDVFGNVVYLEAEPKCPFCRQTFPIVHAKSKPKPKPTPTTKQTINRVTQSWLMVL